MIDTLTETAVLRGDDLKALRTADSIVFRMHKGVATIEAGLEGGWGEEPRIFTPTQQRTFPTTDTGSRERIRVVTVQGVITSYDRDETRRPTGDEGVAFEMIHSAQYSDVWQTVVSLLRVGDALTLHFVADGDTTDYLRKAGLHGDRLDLVVRRGEGRPMTFTLDSRVCPANTARMIKPLGY